MDEIVAPLRRAPGGSPTFRVPGGCPTFSTGSQSSHWDSACPVGILQPAPSMRDVQKLSPLVTHRVHTEPLSGLIFTQESVLTISREGHIKIWMRRGLSESQSNSSDSVLNSGLKEKPLLSGKLGSSSYKQLQESLKVRQNQSPFHGVVFLHGILVISTSTGSITVN